MPLLGVFFVCRKDLRIVLSESLGFPPFRTIVSRALWRTSKPTSQSSNQDRSCSHRLSPSVIVYTQSCDARRLRRSKIQLSTVLFPLTADEHIVIDMRPPLLWLGLFLSLLSEA